MTFEEYAACYPLRRHTCKFILNLLADRPRRLKELQAEVRYAADYLRRLLNSLHAEGLVYVLRWERAWARVNSPWVEVWARGPGISMPIPRLNAAEKKEQKRLDGLKRRLRKQRLKKARMVAAGAGLSLGADLLRLSQ